jgi:peptide/nickel transport system substrate-binding protein
MALPQNRLLETYEALRQGKLSRREFMARAAAYGIGAAAALVLVNAVSSGEAAAQAEPLERPSSGTAGQIRGAGGELKVRQWLAPSHAFAPLAGFPPTAALVSSLILEPLLSYAPDGSLLPTLATEVPTRENGGLSADLSRVTLALREGVLWSDGEPFTAEDVVWTWQWITDEANGSINREYWSRIASIEALSPSQVELVYARPTLAWFVPIAGAFIGSIIPRHAWSSGDLTAVNAEFAIDPIGTGPYRIDTFGPNQDIVCSTNEHYREPNKPYFSTVRFQGGGDSASAAQAVLQTGDWDVAPVLQMKPSVLREMESAGGKGKLAGGLPTDVERILFNFSDPNRVIDGERSSLQAPHPFLTDRAVRQAMAMAIDREKIANELFFGGDFTPPSRNILTGNPAMESPNTSFEFNRDAANELLDNAGWARERNTRFKNGVELKVTFYTSVIDDNAQLMRFRPEIQTAVKEGWEAIGITVELGQVTGDVFFIVTPENEQSYAHFYRDVQMYANGPASPFPDAYLVDWYAGPDNSNVAQQSNDWLGGNIQRYVSPEFDALYEEATSTTDAERAVELFIQMNDLVVGDFVVVPLVARPFMVHALSNRLAEENTAPSSWEPLFWNIANWRTVE